METELVRCRLCLSEDVVKQNIFENKDENGIDFRTKIMLCTSLTVVCEDGYSKYICNHCADMVDLFFDFRNTCFKSHITMHQALSHHDPQTFLIQVGETEKDNISIKDNEKHDLVSEMMKPLFQNIVKDATSVASEEVEEYEDEQYYDDKTSDVFTESIEVNGKKRNCDKELEKEADGEEIIVTEDIDTEEDGFKKKFQVGCYVVLDHDTSQQQQITDKPGLNLLRRYKCISCNYVFSSIAELDAHWESCCTDQLDDSNAENLLDETKEPANSDETYYEEEEEEEEETNVKTDTKKKKTTNYKEFCCETCGKVFKQLLLLKRHIQVKHVCVKPFSCPNCPRTFYDKYELKYHQRLHQDLEDFRCNLCGRRFARKSGLKAHMRSHTGEKPFGCKLCGKSFAHVNSLLAHERVHTGERPYACSYCDRTFTQYSTARSHEDMHMGGERMFQCETCDRMYRTEAELSAHSATHTGLMLFRCQHCDKGFKKQSELTKHVQRYHCDSKPFPCDQCIKSFVTLRELKAHSTVHTGELPFTCVFCEKSYRLKATLKRHMYKHHQLDMELLEDSTLFN